MNPRQVEQHIVAQAERALDDILCRMLSAQEAPDAPQTQRRDWT
jgi:hypothetical protein